MLTLGQEYIRSQDANYYIAKFNKDIISPIVKPKDIESSITVSQFSSLKMTVLFIEDNTHLMGNIIAEQLIKEVLANGETRWYKIVNVSESSSNNSIAIEALSLEHELTMREVEYVEIDGKLYKDGEKITIEEYLKFMLYNSRYSIGNIEDFKNQYIKFSTSFNNKYEAIENIRTLFNCTVIFDNINDKVNLFDSETYGRRTGVTLHHNNVLKDFNVTESRESIVTRLYVRGEDNLSISNVNPTGKPYIEDYSPLIYGYTKTDNNVIKGSPFLSDELCDALIAIEKTKDENVAKVTELQTERLGLESEAKRLQLILGELESNLRRIEGKISILQSTSEPNIEEIESVQTQKEVLKNRHVEVSEEIVTIILQLEDINEELNKLYDSVDVEKVLPKKLYDELKSGGIKEGTYVNNAISNEVDLFYLGTQEMENKRLAKINLEIDVVDFLNINDYFFDNNSAVEELIRVEDKIHVTYEKFNMFYEAKINSINRNDNGIKLYLSNVNNLQTNLSLFTNILGRANRIGELAKSMEDKMKEFDETIKLLEKRLREEIDLNRTEALSSVGNNIRLGVDGLTSFDIDNPNHIMRLNNSRLQISKDGFKTFETIADTDGIKGGATGDVSIMDVKFPDSHGENLFFGDEHYVSKTSIATETTIVNPDVGLNGEGDYVINIGGNSRNGQTMFGIRNTVSDGGILGVLKIGNNKGNGTYGRSNIEIESSATKNNLYLEGENLDIYGSLGITLHNRLEEGDEPPVKIIDNIVNIKNLEANYNNLYGSYINSENIKSSNGTISTLKSTEFTSNSSRVTGTSTVKTLAVSDSALLKGTVSIDKLLKVKDESIFSKKIEVKDDIILNISASFKWVGGNATIPNDISTYKELNVIYENVKTNNNVISTFPLLQYSTHTNNEVNLKTVLTLLFRGIQRLVYELNEQGIEVGK